MHQGPPPMIILMIFSVVILALCLIRLALGAARIATLLAGIVACVAAMALIVLGGGALLIMVSVGFGLAALAVGLVYGIAIGGLWAVSAFCTVIIRFTEGIEKGRAEPLASQAPDTEPTPDGPGSSCPTATILNFKDGRSVRPSNETVH